MDDCSKGTRGAPPVVNLDYDARSVLTNRRINQLPPSSLTLSSRVPIPFSFFPSAYRDETEEETTRVKVEGETRQRERVGREDRYSSVSASLPGRNDRTRYDEEEVRIYEEDRDRRPARKEDTVIYDNEQDRYRDHRRKEIEISRRKYVWPSTASPSHNNLISYQPPRARPPLY